MISMYKTRDSSPDSVIFTLESNFSLFSSASASVDRCSFASDAHDRDSFASELSLVRQSSLCLCALFMFPRLEFPNVVCEEENRPV